MTLGDWRQLGVFTVMDKTNIFGQRALAVPVAQVDGMLSCSSSCLVGAFMSDPVVSSSELGS